MFYRIILKKFNPIKCYYQNTRGLRSTLGEVRQHIHNNAYDVYVLTETWLCSGIFDAELFSGSYTVYRRDRETSSFNNHKKIGGGVLIAVSNNLVSSRMVEWESNCEDLWVTIQTKSSSSVKSLKICAVYLPPPVSTEVLEHFTENCNSIMSANSDSPTLMIGDFNLSCVDWIHDAENEFCLPSS